MTATILKFWRYHVLPTKYYTAAKLPPEFFCRPRRKVETQPARKSGDDMVEVLLSSLRSFILLSSLLIFSSDIFRPLKRKSSRTFAFIELDTAQWFLISVLGCLPEKEDEVLLITFKSSRERCAVILCLLFAISDALLDCREERDVLLLLLWRCLSDC